MFILLYELQGGDGINRILEPLVYTAEGVAINMAFWKKSSPCVASGVEELGEDHSGKDWE